jgi:hypothetical protein
MARVLMAADNTVTHEPSESRLETEGYDPILAEDGTSTHAAVWEQEPGGPTGSGDSGADDSVSDPFGPRAAVGFGRAVPPWIGVQRCPL